MGLAQLQDSSVGPPAGCSQGAALMHRGTVSRSGSVAVSETGRKPALPAGHGGLNYEPKQTRGMGQINRLI